MLRNHLKLAIRNLQRKKLYTLINFTGLTIASAFAILVYLYVQYERSFDHFHPNVNRLYRLELNDISGIKDTSEKKSFFSFLMKEDEEKHMLVMPARLGDDIKRELPEIKEVVRFSGSYAPVIKVNDQRFKEDGEQVGYVEPNFFQVFNFPLKMGNAQSALINSNQVVLSERAAKKYFGNENPIGKTLSISDIHDKLFSVSAVAENFPSNSSFQYDVIFPVNADEENFKSQLESGLNSFNHPTIIELKENVSLQAFARKLENFSQSYFAPKSEKQEQSDPTAKKEEYHLTMRPFAEAHYNMSPGWPHYTDLKVIYQLVCLTLIILLIACVNYVLLTLTSTVARSHEVGIRKTIGAGRRQIILQFWTETQVLVLLSVAGGYVLATICLPLFNSLLGSQVHIDVLSTGTIVWMLLCLALVLGIVAGAYPAFAMSGLKPLKIMRQFATYKMNPSLSKVFVVLQYTACIILIIASIVAMRQMHYINQHDIGFDKEQVVMIENPFAYDWAKTPPLRNRFYQYAASDPAIADASASAYSFPEGFNSNHYVVNGKDVMLSALEVDFNYFNFMHIPMLKGRGFSPAFRTDTIRITIPDALKNPKSNAARRPVVINETLYKMLGEPPVNEFNKTMGGVIIGVCKDYNFQQLTKKIGPAYHVCSPNVISHFYVRIKPVQSLPAVMDRIKSNWNKMTGNELFSYTFLDETVNKVYEPYQRWMRTITVFCWMAVFLACLGLFGLSGLNTINRTKEIGIRKVLGAGVSNIFLLLNKQIIWLASLSMLIGIPLATYLSNEWLQNFAYRIQLDWSIYLVAGCIGIISAVLAVSYHTLKAARANPTKSLRTE